MPETLAALVRAKYPGAYDDLSDADLEAKIDAKFPGAYSDLPRSAQKAPQAQPAAPGRTEGEGSIWDPKNIAAGFQSRVGPLVEGAIGAAKGVGSTAIGLGELARRAVGADTGTSGTAEALGLRPTNPAQAAGFGAEQMAEFMVPGGATRGVVGAGVQAAKAGATAAAQGGSPATAAAFGAAGPLAVSLGSKLGPVLKESAQRQMARVLGPTTKENKAITEKVVPQLLERGFKGATRKSLLNKASAKLAKTGFDLEKELAKIPQGQPVNTGPIVKHLEDAKQAFIVNGVEIDSGAVARIGDLQKTVTDLGPDVSFKSLRRVRQILDEVVAQARGFHGKTLAEGSAIDAKRELAGAIRAELAKAAPDVAKVNKEYSFWANVEKVLEETVERTQSQSKPLGEQLVRGAAVAGGLGGAATGSAGTAVPMAVALAAVNRLIRTTGWNTVAAVNKHRLSELLASGRFDDAALLAAKLGAGAVSQ